MEGVHDGEAHRGCCGLRGHGLPHVDEVFKSAFYSKRDLDEVDLVLATVTARIGDDRSVDLALPALGNVRVPADPSSDFLCSLLAASEVDVTAGEWRLRLKGHELGYLSVAIGPEEDRLPSDKHHVLP